MEIQIYTDRGTTPQTYRFLLYALTRQKFLKQCTVFKIKETYLSNLKGITVKNMYDTDRLI